MPMYYVTVDKEVHVFSYFNENRRAVSFELIYPYEVNASSSEELINTIQAVLEFEGVLEDGERVASVLPLGAEGEA